MALPTRLEELLAAYTALLDNLVTFAITVALVYAIGRLLVEPAAGFVMDLQDTDRTLREALERVVGVAVVIVAVVTGLTVAGFSFLLERAAILVAALTVAIGFAAQNVVGNLVSGAFIVSDPAFNIGDWIRWDDQEGIIEDITFRATRVRTFDNEVVTVPNSTLTSTAVTNAVLSDALRLEVPVEINYDDDLDAAVRILTEAAIEHPDVLEEPEPVVRITHLGETIHLATYVWIADPDRVSYGRVRSEFAKTVVGRLEEAGIDLGAANPQAIEGGLAIRREEYSPED